jgi:hypothetical protein
MFGILSSESSDVNIMFNIMKAPHPNFGPNAERGAIGIQKEGVCYCSWETHWYLGFYTRQL